MDDLSSKLSSLLSDEESVDQLKNLAASLGIGTSSESETKSGDVIDPAFASMVSKLMTPSSGGGSESELLLALKPYLSETKKAKVDDSIKILKLLSLLPLVTDLDILSFLGGDGKDA